MKFIKTLRVAHNIKNETDPLFCRCSAHKSSIAYHKWFKENSQGT